jgi:hypothetical protein
MLCCVGMIVVDWPGLGCTSDGGAEGSNIESVS